MGASRSALPSRLLFQDSAGMTAVVDRMISALESVRIGKSTLNLHIDLSGVGLRILNRGGGAHEAVDG